MGQWRGGQRDGRAVLVLLIGTPRPADAPLSVFCPRTLNGNMANSIEDLIGIPFPNHNSEVYVV